MAARPEPGKKYFTAAQANAMLPLVRAVVQDITDLAAALRERHERTRPGSQRPADDAYQEELDSLQQEMERDQDRMRELIEELTDLGIELKDPFTGLIDYPCWMGDREVYLCWRLGEPTVAHWHELHAGFAGRQPLVADRDMSKVK
jgi:hypothetical protein